MKKWMKTPPRPRAQDDRQRRLLNAGLALTGLMLAVVLGILWVRMTELLQVRSWLLDSSSALLIETIEFESRIGFGGFIHNYKNAILRPKELYHLVSAQADLVKALQILHSIEGLTRAIGTPVDLQPVREALEQYGRSIVLLREQAGRPISPQALDELVRIQTTGAVDSLVRLVELARQTLEDRLDEVRLRIERISDWFALAAALLTALLVFLLTKRQIDTATLQDIAGRRAQYLFDLMLEGMIAVSADRRIVFLNAPAQDLLGAAVGATPCAWPGTIRLRARDPIASDTAPDDLLAKALGGQSYQGYPALVAHEGSATAEPVRLTTRKVSGNFLHPIDTVLFLVRDPAARPEQAAGRSARGRPAAQT
jgi:PAS domain-containing protein